MSGPPVPTSRLTPDSVPRLTERDKMRAFALTFGGEEVRDAYERRDSLGLTNNGVADLDKWRVGDMRLDLFLAQRRARVDAEQGDDLAWSWFMERAVVMVAHIRHRLFDEPVPER